VTADGGRFVVLGGEASRLRRRLGPTAWAVLEELVTHADGPAERCEATSTTRSLSGDLGLSKDAVARALLRLRRAGIISATQLRTSAGTFTNGSYHIAVPGCIVIDANADTTSPKSPQHATRRNGSQLALSLDD